jgi:hypothetical protein
MHIFKRPTERIWCGKTGIYMTEDDTASRILRGGELKARDQAREGIGSGGRDRTADLGVMKRTHGKFASFCLHFIFPGSKTKRPCFLACVYDKCEQ